MKTNILILMLALALSGCAHKRVTVDAFETSQADCANRIMMTQEGITAVCKILLNRTDCASTDSFKEVPPEIVFQAIKEAVVACIEKDINK